MNHTDYKLYNGKTLRIYINCDQQYIDNNIISPEEGVGHCVMCFPREELATNALDYNFLHEDSKYSNFVYIAFYTEPNQYEAYLNWFVDTYNKPVLPWAEITLGGMAL